MGTIEWRWKIIIKSWKVKAYEVLVKVGKPELEDHEGNTLPVVCKDYVIAAAELLGTGELTV
ncbi:hypothetical protein [Tissierella sp.]|uniref:hypothetical protein n=1 Tax=Tissierella sp. TaxID=41274 RepID=UPI0028B13877|nr:hypothetical protein [Tissierella sp.]